MGQRKLRRNFADAASKIQKKTDPGLALLVIDVQARFCDAAQRGTRRTEKIARRIARLLPAFRRAGIPVYVIYFDKHKDTRLARPLAEVDFYKFKPKSSDTVFAKSTDSAFADHYFHGILERDQRKKLLLCGFNLNACVAETARSALACRYSVDILRDLVGNDGINTRDPEPIIRALAEEGVRFIASNDILTPKKRRKLGLAPV